MIDHDFGERDLADLRGVGAAVPDEDDRGVRGRGRPGADRGRRGPGAHPPPGLFAQELVVDDAERVVAVVAFGSLVLLIGFSRIYLDRKSVV